MQMPELEPGKKLTDREKAALAKDNERMTKQAMEQARVQHEADIRSGKRPAVVEVAEGLKERLQNEDFSKR